MTDKPRHPRTLAPRGALGNWALLAWMVGATAVAVAWRALVG